MQIRLFGVRVAAITIAFLIVMAYTAVAARGRSIPVTVRCNADDGLSLRLRDTLENTIKSSANFSLSSSSEPSTFLIIIASNVRSKQVDRRTRVFYTVEFASGHHRDLGTTSGSCWVNTLTKCAAQIIKKVRSAAREDYQ